MSKIKTNKSARKRFNISGKNKLRRRPTGQNHFNARDNGKETRNKRGYLGTPKDSDKSMRKIFPYI